MSFFKGNPGLTPNFSKSKKDIKLNWFQCMIALLFYFWYIVHSYLAMDGCTATNFVKHVKIVFVQVGVVCAAWWYFLFAGAFTTKQQFMHPHCIVCYDKTWTKTVCAVWWHLRELSQQSTNSCIRTALCTMTKLGRRQFWHALQKLLLSSHPWPNMNNQFTIWKKNKYAIIHW